MDDTISTCQKGLKKCKNKSKFFTKQCNDTNINYKEDIASLSSETPSQIADLKVTNNSRGILMKTGVVH